MGFRRILWAAVALPVGTYVLAQDPPYANNTEIIPTSSVLSETVAETEIPETTSSFARANPVGNWGCTATVHSTLKSTYTVTAYTSTVTRCGEHCCGGSNTLNTITVTSTIPASTVTVSQSNQQTVSITATETDVSTYTDHEVTTTTFTTSYPYTTTVSKCPPTQSTPAQSSSITIAPYKLKGRTYPQNLCVISTVTLWSTTVSTTSYISTKTDLSVSTDHEISTQTTTSLTSVTTTELSLSTTTTTSYASTTLTSTYTTQTSYPVTVISSTTLYAIQTSTLTTTYSTSYPVVTTETATEKTTSTLTEKTTEQTTQKTTEKTTQTTTQEHTDTAITTATRLNHQLPGVCHPEHYHIYYAVFDESLDLFNLLSSDCDVHFSQVICHNGPQDHYYKHDDNILRANHRGFYLCPDHKLPGFRHPKHYHLYHAVFDKGIDVLNLVPSDRDLYLGLHLGQGIHHHGLENHDDVHDDYIVRADDCSFFLCLDHKLSRLRDTKHNRLYDSVFHPGIDILYLVPSNRDLNPCVDRQGDYYKEHNNDVVRANDGSFYLCLNHKLSRLCDKKHDRLYDSVFYPGVNILYLISSDRDLNPGVDRSGDYYKEHNADGLRVDNLDLYLHRLDQLSCLLTETSTATASITATSYVSTTLYSTIVVSTSYPVSVISSSTIYSTLYSTLTSTISTSYLSTVTDTATTTATDTASEESTVYIPTIIYSTSTVSTSYPVTVISSSTVYTTEFSISTATFSTSYPYSYTVTDTDTDTSTVTSLVPTTLYSTSTVSTSYPVVIVSDHTTTTSYTSTVFTTFISTAVSLVPSPYPTTVTEAGVTTTLPGSTIASTVTIPASTVVIAASTVTLPGAVTTLPGSVTTIAASTVTLPGIVTTVPASTVTVSGSTVTLPASTVTLPGLSTTLPGSTLTLPGSVTTLPGSVTTLPGSIVTIPGCVTTLPGGSITTLLGSIVTVPGATTVLTVTSILPQVTTTIALGGTSTVVSIIPGVTSVTTVVVTLPGTTQTLPAPTITRTILTTTLGTATVCPAPSATAPGQSAPLDPRSNLTWGCLPGFVCSPKKPANCNLWADSPADDFLCNPSDCIPAPNHPEIHWAENQTGYYPPTDGYFNLNPNAFGLTYDIFEVTEIIEKVDNIFTSTIYTGNWASQTDLTHFPPTTTTSSSLASPTSHGPYGTSRSSTKRGVSLRKREGDDGTDTVPAVCYAICNDAYLEAQEVGKSSALCRNKPPPPSVYQQEEQACRDCITLHGGDNKLTVKAYLNAKFAH
ncbi:hypothetical protein DL546_009409 [Coniochaeta pulveracea]|uniref:Uncharacterized protein n=1 Tax=Coniochaeta pulveracea TaxID=177199 RepID=A0A420YM24_9PEZI|nr:hypothetical protein DL546_009409 [Coniochaeta pulveracea]